MLAQPSYTDAAELCSCYALTLTLPNYVDAADQCCCHRPLLVLPTSVSDVPPCADAPTVDVASPAGATYLCRCSYQCCQMLATRAAIACQYSCCTPLLMLHENVDPAHQFCSSALNFEHVLSRGVRASFNLPRLTQLPTNLQQHTISSYEPPFMEWLAGKACFHCSTFFTCTCEKFHTYMDAVHMLSHQGLTRWGNGMNDGFKEHSVAGLQDTSDDCG
jgi:hypothetical protein